MPDYLNEKENLVSVFHESKLEFTPHRRGFLKPNVKRDENIVFRVKQERACEGDVRLATELWFEVSPQAVNLGTLPSPQGIVRALLHFGEQQLQFESTTCDGEVAVRCNRENGLYAGEVKLRFTRPTVDLLGSESSDVHFRFQEVRD